MASPAMWRSGSARYCLGPRPWFSALMGLSTRRAAGAFIRGPRRSPRCRCTGRARGCAGRCQPARAAAMRVTPSSTAWAGRRRREGAQGRGARAFAACSAGPQARREDFTVWCEAIPASCRPGGKVRGRAGRRLSGACRCRPGPVGTGAEGQPQSSEGGPPRKVGLRNLDRDSLVHSTHGVFRRPPQR